MADYPKQIIAKLDATCTKEAWPFLGLLILAMAVTAGLLYIVGTVVDSML